MVVLVSEEQMSVSALWTGCYSLGHESVSH